MEFKLGEAENVITEIKDKNVKPVNEKGFSMMEQ